ncbi:arrestin domain-containing protein 2-like [Branchiostoma floridae x Branchiostoma japonicum]
MEKLRQFAIEFDERKDVFEPGEFVKGHVVVDLAEKMKIKGLWLQFHGRSKVSFDIHDDDYTASETYLSHEVTLFGNEQGQTGDGPVTSHVLPAGRHAFPFQVQLPADGLPCSFEWQRYGYVRYTINATIGKPYQSTEKVFQVLDKGEEDSWEGFSRTHPPNMVLSNRDEDPVAAECCSSGPVELQAQPDRTVYCPGEVITIRGTVENNSSADDVKHVEARLVQVGTFHGRWGRTSWRVEEATNIVERVRLPNSVCKRGGRSFAFSPSDGAVLRVPPLSSLSLLRFCRIIDLGYRLDVVAKMSSAGSPKVKIPIKICSCRHHPHGTAQPSFATPCAAPQDSAQTPCTDPPAYAAPLPYVPGPVVVTQPTSRVPIAPDLDCASVRGVSTSDSGDSDYKRMGGLDGCHD